MSLINDALKKTQKMRHEESLASARQSHAGRDTQQGAAKPRLSTGAIALIAGGTAVLVCGTVLATILLLRGGREAPSASSPAVGPQAAIQPAPAQGGLVRSEPEVLVQTQPQAVATPPASIPAASSATTVPTKQADAGPVISLPVIANTPPKPLAEETPVQAAEKSPEKAAAAAPSSPSFVFTTPEPDHLHPNPAAQRFVNRARVTGVRKTSSGAKVIINDRVYRINDVVDSTLGLRLTAAEPDRLVFTDEYGHRYERNF